MKGVLITCSDLESMCVREAYDVLNEVSVNPILLDIIDLHFRIFYINHFYVMTQMYCSLAVPPLCLERKGLGKAVYTTRTRCKYIAAQSDSSISEFPLGHTHYS